MPTFNVGGTDYPFPEPKKEKWGNELTIWASAVSTQINQALGSITLLNAPYTAVNETATGVASLSLVLNDIYFYDTDLSLVVTPIKQEKIDIFLTNLDPLLPSYADLQTDGYLSIQIKRDAVSVFETTIGFDSIGQARFSLSQIRFTEILPTGSYQYDIGFKLSGTAGS